MYVHSFWRTNQLVKQETDCHCTLIYRSRVQRIVNAATQCLWLQGLLGECGFEWEYSTTIYCDNQSTIRIYNDPVQNQRTKHIQIHMHYIRELVHDGTIHLLFSSSSEQVADIFTKAFCEKTFSNIKSILGITDHAVNHEWRQDFQILFYSPCLREDFPTGFFCLFPWFNGHAVCKGWLSLVARPYNFLI